MRDAWAADVGDEGVGDDEVREGDDGCVFEVWGADESFDKDARDEDIQDADVRDDEEV